MKRPLHIITACLLLSCNKEKLFDGPDFYTDDFENYSSFEQLLPEGDEKWSLTQQTVSSNSIVLDTTNVHWGNQSLKFSAKRSEDKIVSKCSLMKQNMAFWEGETLRMSAWYYIEGNNSLQWLFLMDMEEQTAIGAGPGMRLALVDNKLRVEHKFNERDIVQTEGTAIDFPRDQWVEIIWEVHLSQKHTGSVKLWQNGQLILNADNERTLPKDILYSLQGTKGMYSSMEIGITANSRDSDLILWVDDVRFEMIK